MQIQTYRNLTRGGFSVKTREEGKWKVTDHALAVGVVAATFKVLESGRIRSVEKQREVHAWITGERIDPAALHNTGRLIRYNPFQTTTFIFADTGEAVYSAAAVILINEKVYLAELI